MSVLSDDVVDFGLEQINYAKTFLDKNESFWKTPLLSNVQKMFKMNHLNLYLKLENMQNTGSFKIRGVITQISSIMDAGSEIPGLISMSAGNYGKAFAYYAERLKLHSVCILPETAPANRKTIIESYGTKTISRPTEHLQRTVDELVAKDNMLFLHPFDDLRLISGYGSIAVEILEEMSDNPPDVILVGCGGGGLLAAISSTVRFSGLTGCRVYGVEPDGSNSMYQSLQQNRPVTIKPSSIASGLSPPYAGKNCFNLVRQHATGIICVPDSAIVRAQMTLRSHGLLVEASGAAGFAALQSELVPDTAGKNVVVIVTGGNVTPEEILSARDMFAQN